MKKTINRIAAAALCACMVLSLAACGSSNSSSSASTTAAAAEDSAEEFQEAVEEVAEEKEAEAGDVAAEEVEESASKPGEGVKIGLVTDVAGTQVFILDMIDGLNAAAEKYGFEAIVAECADSAAYEDNARALIEEGVDLLIGGGWESEDAIYKMATEYPDRADYALIDDEIDLDNVKCISFHEQEGAYLIGMLASLVVDDDAEVFGAVHVSTGPGSWKWRWGFMEGVKTKFPDAQFIFNYVGDYNDPAKAKEYAIQQYEQGCQFINSSAAGGDQGVFEAALENGFYTSGQDVDLTTPDNPNIVSCQIKDTSATMQYLMDQYFGDWTLENETLGVKEGAIGAVYVTHETDTPRSDRLSDDDVALLKETAEKIASGEIDLQTTMPDEEDYVQ